MSFEVLMIQTVSSVSLIPDRYYMAMLELRRNDSVTNGRTENRTVGLLGFVGHMVDGE